MFAAIVMNFHQMTRKVWTFITILNMNSLLNSHIWTLEPEVILEELGGQVSLKPGKHRCNQACDFSTDTRERLDVHLCIEHEVYRTKCEQCDYSHEYPCVLRSHVRSVHEKIRHKCNLCERTYATKDGLRMSKMFTVQPKLRLLRPILIPVPMKTTEILLILMTMRTVLMKILMKLLKRLPSRRIRWKNEFILL